VTKPVVILVSPKGAANLGGISRLMANFGLAELRLVAPRVDRAEYDVKARALESYPIIESAKIFETLGEALADLHFSVAYTMRLAGSHAPGSLLSTLPAKVYLQDQAWGIVFGREDNGLETEELRLCRFQIQIPTEEFFPSMNLTSSVAVALWDWYSKSSSGFENVSLISGQPKHAEVEIFFDQLKGLLSQLGFIKHPESDHILRDLRDMYNRAAPDERDLRILFGILSDLKRVLGIKASVSSKA
jgi:tRNA/rRNA methyltransferase